MERRDKKKTDQTAFEAACAYLASRMRTTGEVRKHLESKGYGSGEITEAVNDLIGMRYLDDYQYALRYYEYNREKKRGSMRAERELAEKGIDRETIQNAREDFLHEQMIDEYEDALEIARKEVFVPGDAFGDGTKTREVDDRLSAKVARKLESRGFARGDIYRVLDEMRRWSEESD